MFESWSVPGGACPAGSQIDHAPNRREPRQLKLVIAALGELPILGPPPALCAAPSYLSERGRPEQPHDLQNHACIVIRENNTAFNNWQVSDAKQQILVKVRGPLSTNHGEIAVDWALAGHGIVLRSEWDIAGYLRSGQLVRVLEPWLGSSADIHAIYPQRHHLSAKVRVFIDFLAERFADYRSGDESGTAAW